MSDKGKYIYGVINTQSSGPAADLPGSNGTYIVPYRDVAAIVGDAEIHNYTDMPVDVAARHLAEYQLVIEKVMQKFAIIPARLGTHVLTEDEVTQVLIRGYPVFREIFNEIVGRIEIDVVAGWVDLNEVIREVSGNEEMMALKQSLLDKKEGITVDDRIKMGMLIKGLLDRKKDEFASTIKDSLRDLCRNTREYVMTDDGTILNGAFFVDNGMRIPFEERLVELNDGFDGKVYFKCVGPLPPYSFYVFEVRRFQWEEIDRAREKLGLDTFTTKDDIKRAYRRCASRYHPDRQLETQSETKQAQTKIEYDETTKAYRLLSEYCEHERCSMKKEEFAGNSLIVRTREQ
jgi:hypothetical protein